jgi:hypothetical protein
MMNSEVDLHEAVISSDNFTISPPKSFDYYQTRLRFGSHSDGNIEALLGILRQMAKMDLPGKEHAEGSHGCSVSSTIAFFSLADHRRRRRTDVMISAGPIDTFFLIVKHPVIW